MQVVRIAPTVHIGPDVDDERDRGVGDQEERDQEGLKLLREAEAGLAGIGAPAEVPPLPPRPGCVDSVSGLGFGVKVYTTVSFLSAPASDALGSRSVYEHCMILDHNSIQNLS